MRTRERIEYSKGINEDCDPDLEIAYNSRLVVELLLDIRDLLTKES